MQVTGIDSTPVMVDQCIRLINHFHLEFMHDLEAEKSILTGPEPGIESAHFLEYIFTYQQVAGRVIIHFAVTPLNISVGISSSHQRRSINIPRSLAGNRIGRRVTAGPPTPATSARLKLRTALLSQLVSG